jgi:hypothetical protein
MSVLVTQSTVIAIRPDELHGARAVFADDGEQGEGIARRHAEPLAPALEGHVIVGQQAAQPWLDAAVLVSLDDQRHRQRQRPGAGMRPPGGVVNQRQPPATVAHDLAHDLPVGDQDQTFVHVLSSRAA